MAEPKADSIECCGRVRNRRRNHLHRHQHRGCAESSAAAPVVYDSLQVVVPSGQSPVEALIAASTDVRIRPTLLKWLDESEQWLREHPSEQVRGLPWAEGQRIVRILRQAVDEELRQAGAGVALVRSNAASITVAEFEPIPAPDNDFVSTDLTGQSTLAESGPTPNFEGLQRLEASICDKSNCDPVGNATIYTFINLYFRRARVGYRVTANPIGFWRNVVISLACDANCGSVSINLPNPTYETGSTYLNFTRTMTSGTWYFETTSAGTPNTGVAGSVTGRTPSFRCRAAEEQCKFGW